MSDAAYALFLAIVIWLAFEFNNDGGGGTRQRLQVPLS
jgi:hypothetical protein